MNEITPITWFDGWCAKREDLACHIGADRPSGAKVRQYLGMVSKFPKGTPMVVGCSAFASQQIYVADAALRANAPAFIFVPKRKEKTEATKWCENNGVIVSFVSPGYPSVYRSEARKKSKELGGCIKWDSTQAIKDTMEQVVNIPESVARVVVISASGLTAAGVIAGLAEIGASSITVKCVAVSELASLQEVIKIAAQHTQKTLPKVEYERVAEKYGKAVKARLPDGTPLDCNYTAKAMRFVQPGDCLWVSGMRPLSVNK